MMGRICNDLEIKASSSGKSYLRFSIAVPRSMKNDNGEYDTDFFQAVAFGGSADFICSHFSKGDKILLVGSFRNDNYEKDGVMHYKDTLYVQRVEFAGGKYNLPNVDYDNTGVESKKNTDKEMQQDGVAMIGDLADFEEIISDGGVPF